MPGTKIIHYQVTLMIKKIKKGRRNINGMKNKQCWK